MRIRDKARAKLDPPLCCNLTRTSCSASVHRPVIVFDILWP